MVVDTVDPLSIGHNPFGGELTFSSTATDSSYPVGPAAPEVITGCPAAGVGSCPMNCCPAPYPLRGTVGAPGSSVPGSAGAMSAASVFGLRRCLLAIQLANQESNMHIPM